MSRGAFTARNKHTARRELVAHLSAGGHLRLEFRNSDTEPEFWSCPTTGTRFTAAACRWAYRRGFIGHRRDGLFPDLIGQTFEPYLGRIRDFLEAKEDAPAGT